MCKNELFLIKKKKKRVLRSADYTLLILYLLKPDIISIILNWVCKPWNVVFGKELLLLFQLDENENVLRMDMTAVLVETGILLKATKPT